MNKRKERFNEEDRIYIQKMKKWMEEIEKKALEKYLYKKYWPSIEIKTKIF